MRHTIAPENTLSRYLQAQPPAVATLIKQIAQNCHSKPNGFTAFVQIVFRVFQIIQNGSHANGVVSCIANCCEQFPTHTEGVKSLVARTIGLPEDYGDLKLSNHKWVEA